MPTEANGALVNYTILYNVDNSSLMNKTVPFNGQLVRMNYLISTPTHVSMHIRPNLTSSLDCILIN